VTLGGGVKLQVVFGDITNETTDAVVNTTNFTDFQTGDSETSSLISCCFCCVCTAKVNRGDVFKTQPGSFPCKAILHVCGEKDAAVVEQLVCSIIQLCESSGHKSVAIPAICAGMTDKMLNNNTLQHFKLVALQPSSVEYRTVEQKFTQTVHKTVIKIERLQNVYLRRAYDARKNHISEKNGQDVGAGEKLLYHGTSQDTCESIKKNGFDRGFSGKNATSFGQGTYFAVKASYSARSTYSQIADDGSQAVFVARVLTGFYTQGNSSMRVPPRRDSYQSHDYYDSVVDRIDNPSMYVVFHDNQAYPDYLITFC
uniref:Poly [ADP-ribose] polymerase n=1 Tax=Amphiprion ocellaris TaxID=80972 RepID=A0A3Q1AGR2_AMPOC